MNHKVYSQTELQERRDKSARIFKEHHRDLMKGSEDIDNYEFLMMQDKDIPDLGFEFLMWNNLNNKVYWTSLSKLNELKKRNVLGNHFSEQDLGRLAETMISQMWMGERAASDVPIFSDVFLLFSDEEKSPLTRFVREEQRVMAINKGFWHCLGATKYENPTEDSRFWSANLKQEYALKEITKLFGCDGFFDYFNFREGVERAVEVPENLCFRGTINLDEYMRWFLVQEEEIYKKLEKEEAVQICGRLVAPMVYELFVEGDWNEREGLMRLANHFIQGEIIKTAPIQRVLGGVYELNLMGAFDERDYSHYDWNFIESCERALLDSESHAKICWERFSSESDIDLSLLDSRIRKYVPAEAYKEMVGGLRQEMAEMKRFDLEVFRKWVQCKEVKGFALSEVGRVRNEALQVYFSQTRRPRAEVVEGLARIVGTGKFGSDYLGDKVRGYLFMDLVAKKRWESANSILMSYNIGRDFGEAGFATLKETKTFEGAVGGYVESHGRVKVDRRGLDSSVCYPHYNKIKDVVENFGSIFVVEGSD